MSFCDDLDILEGFKINSGIHIDCKTSKMQYVQEGYYFPLRYGCKELQDRYNESINEVKRYFDFNFAFEEYLKVRYGGDWKNKILEEALLKDPEMEESFSKEIVDKYFPDFNLEEWRNKRWGAEWKKGFVDELFQQDPTMQDLRLRPFVRKYAPDRLPPNLYD